MARTMPAAHSCASCLTDEAIRLDEWWMYDNACRITSTRDFFARHVHSNHSTLLLNMFRNAAPAFHHKDRGVGGLGVAVVAPWWPRLSKPVDGWKKLRSLAEPVHSRLPQSHNRSPAWCRLNRAPNGKKNMEKRWKRQRSTTMHALLIHSCCPQAKNRKLWIYVDLVSLVFSPFFLQKIHWSLCVSQPMSSYHARLAFNISFYN